MYHFTYASNLEKILENNTIHLSLSLRNSADNAINFNKFYYLSLTNSRNINIGYPASKGIHDIVRIKLNGSLLKKDN